MISNETVEPTPNTKKETIRRQKRERAKSELDRETMNQESFYKLRLIDDDGALDPKPSGNSDGGSIISSEKLGHKRVYRTLSLNIQRNETATQEFKPFLHKELYPFPVQKYLAQSQKNKQFEMTKALDGLKTPDSKSFPKTLDKMRLLGLVQEREIENHLRSRPVNSSLGTPTQTASPLIDGSPINVEISITDEQSGPKPSKFLQMSHQGLMNLEPVEMMVSNLNNPRISMNQHQFPPENNDWTVKENNHPISLNPQGLRDPNLFGSQSFSGPSWNQFSNPMQSNVYPQQQTEQHFPQYQQQQYRLPPQQQQSYPNFYGSQLESNSNPRIQVNPTVIDLTAESSEPMSFTKQAEIIIDDIEDTSHQNPMNQQSALQIPTINLNHGSVSPVSNSIQQEGSQPGGTSLKDFADQQLFKINNLLVQKPKKLYRLSSNDGTMTTNIIPAGLLHSPSVNSPRSPMSDSSFNNHLNLSAFNAALSTSTNKSNESTIVGNGINSLSSIKTDECNRNTLFPPDPNNIANLLDSPSKKNRKAFQRMNTDPSHLDSLIKTINTPNSRSPHHSKNPSFGGGHQTLPPLSQFGLNQCMNTNNSTMNSASGGLSNQLSGSMQFSSMLGSNIPRSIQVARLGTTSITETLAENLPGSPLKKTRGFGRYNTDPTQSLNSLANAIVSSHPGPYYMTEAYKAQQQYNNKFLLLFINPFYHIRIPEYSSYNTVDNPSASELPEDNKSVTDTLNERMNQMTLRSDQGDPNPMISEVPNFSKSNSQFQFNGNDFAFPSTESGCIPTQSQLFGFPHNLSTGDLTNQQLQQPQQASEENFTRLIDTDNFLDLQPNSDNNKGLLLDPDSFLS